MMKLTKRKGFNFFRSYYDVFNELPEKDKLPFIEALLDRQFLGIKPTKLKGMAKFAYISQTNSIDSQVKGYEDKTGLKLLNTPYQGGKNTPTEQVQVEEEVQEKEELKEEGQYLNIVYPFDSEKFLKYWDIWKEYKSKEHKFKFKSEISEQAALKKIGQLANGDEQTALMIIEQSLANGWSGLFEIKTTNNGQSKKGATTEFLKDLLREHDTTK